MPSATIAQPKPTATSLSTTPSQAADANLNISATSPSAIDSQAMQKNHGLAPTAPVAQSVLESSHVPKFAAVSAAGIAVEAVRDSGAWLDGASRLASWLWKGASKTVSHAADWVGHHAKSVVHAIQGTDAPQEVAKSGFLRTVFSKTTGFLGSVLEDVGVTGTLKGLKGALWDGIVGLSPTKFISGVGSTLMGIGTFIYQSTPISDLVGLAKGIRNGDWAMIGTHAIMLGGFALAFGFTAATGGLGAIAFLPLLSGKVALKSLAKQGLERLCKEGVLKLGHEAAEKFVQHLGEKFASKMAVACEKAAKEVAKQATQTAREHIVKAGVAGVEEKVAKTVLQAGKAEAEKLLRHTVLDGKTIQKRIEDSAYDLIKDGIHKRSEKELTAHIAKLGFTTDTKAIARELKQFVAQGHSDKELAKILTQAYTDRVSAALQRGIQPTFSREFREGMQKISRELPKHSEDIARHLDEITLKAEEALGQGIRAGTESVVKDSVEAAIKRFRKEQSKDDDTASAWNPWTPRIVAEQDLTRSKIDDPNSQAPDRGRRGSLDHERNLAENARRRKDDDPLKRDDI